MIWIISTISEGHPSPVGVQLKTMFLKILQNSQENTSVGVSFSESLSQVYKYIKKESYNFIKRETPKEVFFSEFCKSFRSFFFSCGYFFNIPI